MYLPATKKALRMHVAGIAVAMGTNAVALSRVPQDGMKPALRRACGQFVQDVKRWFLPHLLAGIGLFGIMAHVWAWWLLGRHGLFVWLVAIVFLGVYAVAAFGYGLVTACVFALRQACVHWDGFVEEVLDRIQAHMATQVSRTEGLSKPQARALVKGSVRELFVTRPSDKGLARVCMFFTAGAIAAALRAVLCAKIAKWSGTTIQLSKLFAGKTTLAGAVLLNLHFFATILLILCYTVGLVGLLLPVGMIWLLK